MHMKLANWLKVPVLVRAALVGFIAVTSLAPAHADSLPVNNPGFETFALNPNVFSTHIGIGSGFQLLSADPIPGWVLNGHGGSWRPAPGYFPAGVPEGVNIAWLEYDSMHSSVLSQVLVDVLTANTVYTLSVKVDGVATILWPRSACNWWPEATCSPRARSTLFRPVSSRP